MLALLMGLAMTRIFSRGEARRALGSWASPDEQRQRLVRSAAIPVRMTLIFGVAAAGELLLEVPPLRQAWWATLVVTVYLFRLAALATWCDAVLPAERRLRSDRSEVGAVTTTLRTAAVRLAPSYLWTWLFGLMLSRSVGVLGLTVAFASYAAFTGVVSPLLFRLAHPTRRPTAGEQRRIGLISDAFHLDVAGVRFVGGSLGMTANALVTGLGPSGRSIFVTERLLETFDDAELSAVLAHEVGHREHHHLAVRTAVHFAVTLVLGSAIFALLSREALDAGDALPALFLLVALSFVRQAVLGVVSRRQEHEADLFATERVGPVAVRRVLERFGAAEPARSGRARSRPPRSGHPGIQDRLDRLPRRDDVGVTRAS